MRILDIIQEATGPQIYTIGDSHAEGMSYNKGFINKANGGQASTSSTNFGGTHTKKGTPVGLSEVPKGSIIVVAQGANDTATSMKNHINSKGKTPLVPPATIASNVVKVVNAAKAKGQVIFVLFPNGNGRAPGLAKYYSGDYQDEVRKAIRSAVGVPVVDLEGKGLANDGIHGTPGAYKSAGAEVLGLIKNIPQAPQAPQKADSAQKVEPTGETSSVLAIPQGRIGIEVADIQKVLLALGYQLPKHGVDGVRGPETSGVVRQFQKDNGLEVDGDPGPETVAALNKLIASKGIKFTKSTQADVKKQNATAFSGDNPMPTLKMDSVTSGKVGKVLDLIASKESAGYYDMMNGGKRFPEILDMTLAELHQFQERHANRATKRSSAAGRYQIMGFNTANYARKAGLNFKTDKFSPANQDKMGIVFLRECGLEDWLNGKLSNEKFLDKIAGVWAAFADSKGRSPYANDGWNRQGISPKYTLAALDSIQSTTA